MSDIDDLLLEYHGSNKPSRSASDYIPNPAEFGEAYKQASSQGFEHLRQAGSDIYNQGFSPSNIANAAMAGLEYLMSPATAFGQYLGGPVERGITDITGSPTAGQIAGQTVALAPAMAVPFPGANIMRAGTEAAGALTGESAGARMAANELANRMAARNAPASAPDISNEPESIVEKIAPSTRKTSTVDDLEREVALRWFNKQFTGGEPIPSVPSPNIVQPRDIQLLNKGNPKVGEAKYAYENPEAPPKQRIPRVFEGYEAGEGRPTRRTSKMAAQPTREYPLVMEEGGYPTTNLGSQEGNQQPPLAWYESQFPFNRPDYQSPTQQMPLYPGAGARVSPELAQSLREMYLPEVRQQTPIDPNLLAELKLKFGGQTSTGNPPYTPQTTGAVRPPQQMPIPGARPIQPQEQNVIYPHEEMIAPMSPEAAQDVGRLREDLGLPREKPGSQPTQEAPGSEVPSSIAQPMQPQIKAGIELGQPYDIVMAFGPNEMRSPGGIVKDVVYRIEQGVEKGKAVEQSVPYAVLEDERQVPLKLLQRSGTKPTNVQPSAPVEQPAPRAQVQAPTTTEQPAQEVSPEFAAVQRQMAKKTSAKSEPARKPPVASQETAPVEPTAKSKNIRSKIVQDEKGRQEKYLAKSTGVQDPDESLFWRKMGTDTQFMRYMEEKGIPKDYKERRSMMLQYYTNTFGGPRVEGAGGVSEAVAREMGRETKLPGTKKSRRAARKVEEKENE